MALLGAALTVQLSVSSDAIALLSLTVCAAQLVATIWFGRQPKPPQPAEFRRPGGDNPPGKTALTDEELLEQLEAAHRRAVDHAERLTAAINAFRGHT